jgi:hypothetical protein
MMKHRDTKLLSSSFFASADCFFSLFFVVFDLMTGHNNSRVVAHVICSLCLYTDKFA